MPTYSHLGRTYSYHWLHIPTGTKGEGVADTLLTPRSFLTLLNRWNGMQPGVWQYWSTEA